MDFATFTTETQSFLWRVGDTDLQSAMPKIVRSAESRLRTDLKLSEEEVTLDLSVTENPFTLPSDVDVVRSLTWEDIGSGRYVTNNDMGNFPDERPPGGWPLTYHNRSFVNISEYTTEGNRIRHRRTVSAENPVSVRLVYVPRPAGLEAGDDTLFNLYTDLYEKAVYTEALDYLLELERRNDMNAQYTERLDAAMLDQSMRQMPGGPLKMQMPRQDVS